MWHTISITFDIYVILCGQEKSIHRSFFSSIFNKWWMADTKACTCTVSFQKRIFLKKSKRDILPAI